MGLIRRLYVEKKIGCDIEAKHLLDDVRENLGISNLEGLRILNRYDCEGISEADFLSAKDTIFSEPPVDMVYEEEAPFFLGETVFAVEFLPGQYDQRADSAMQCIQLITQGEKPEVAVAKVFALRGTLTNEELEKIKNYCINTVDSREAVLDKPESLRLETQMPQKIKNLDGFILKDTKEVLLLRELLGTAMSGEDLLFCQEYFKNVEKRDPTMTEIKVIDTYWSDHCRHTTFQTKIEGVKVEEGQYTKAIQKAYESYLTERKFVYGEKEEQRDINLMDIAVLGMKTLRKKGILDNLDESDEINACSIVVETDVDGKKEDYLVMFKNETHNHPTEIEPFGGAATCLGGAIRDPLSGRAYVYQAMRVTGAADPRTPVSETLSGKLPQRKITTEAARGYSSYGNQIGIATGQVTEIYDFGFAAKRMEIGAVIAAAPKTHVVRKKPEPGDVIILTGGRTGRDGCGGATGSSKEHTLSSITSCGAEVQKGNAPTERKLQRLFLNTEVSKMIKRCNDFGAGGVSVAIGELADGLVIELDKVQKKYEGLDGTELAISESQERMAVVVDAENAQEFLRLSALENLEATVVAEVTEQRRLKMLWQGDAIVDISRDFLDTNGAKQKTDVFVKLPSDECYFDKTSVPAEKIGEDLKKAWLLNLKRLNCASQKGLVERFDSSIGAGTVLAPFGGAFQKTAPEAMAAKIPVRGAKTTTATLMSYGYYTGISKWSPFHGAQFAVCESVAKIVAAGGSLEDIRLTFQEYFERLGTMAEKWGNPFAALLGAFQAQMELGVAAIGGKDSMSGSFMELTVPPTLVSFAVAPASVDNIISPEFKEVGSDVVFLPMKRDQFDQPDYEYFKNMLTFVKESIKEGICIAAHTVRSGGIAETVSKMAFGNSIGLAFDCEIKNKELFLPEFGSFVLELSSAKIIDFHGLDAIFLGKTIKEPEIILKNNVISLSEALAAWEEPLEKVFAQKDSLIEGQRLSAPAFWVNKKTKPSAAIARPRVFLPVFPGTNCEFDLRNAFEKAGASVSEFVVTNLSAEALKQSIDKMADEIKNSQMIMIPGGFSAGDEPDGSGKFIAAVFRNPKIKEAVMELLKNRDGLMLGICNGFQALVKLGLLPYGEICSMEENSPSLTFNHIGRHVSVMSDTKIVSNKSPWLFNTEPEEIHTIPISHGEGRFIAPDAVLSQLIENGQIATQYVDKKGNPTYEFPFNPNGSIMAIEGITSPDGRVLGKMGHSERIGQGLYKNVPGNKDQKIFEAGVAYFK